MIFFISSIKKLPKQVCTNFKLAHTCKEFQQFDVIQKNLLLWIKEVEKKKENQPLGGSFGVLYLAFWC